MHPGIALGVIIALIGAGCLFFGISTGAMPPVSTNLYFLKRGPTYEDEDRSAFWLDGALWCALMLFGFYQIYSNW